MRRILLLLMIVPVTGCHVARATITYHFDEPTVSLTLEPRYGKNIRASDCRQPQAKCEAEMGTQN